MNPKLVERFAKICNSKFPNSSKISLDIRLHMDKSRKGGTIGFQSS